jgi:hypothetical protein
MMADDWITPSEGGADDWIGPTAQAGPALADKLSQTWPARLLAPLVRAAPLPGQVASGELNVQPETPGQWSDVDEARLQATNAEIVKRTVEAAPFASPTPAVMRGAGAEGILGVPTKGPIAPSIEQMRAAATAGYEHPTVQDVRLDAGAGPALADQIYAHFNQPGVDIHKALVPRTSAVLDDLYKLPKPEEGETDPFLTVANLRSTYRQLGKAAASPDATERLAAKTAQNSIHEFLANMPEQYVIQGDPKAAGAIIQEANANYAAMSRAADLDTRLTRAQLRAAAANSGMNVGNTIRQRMADVASNPTLARRVPPDELAMMKGIAEGNTGDNLTRYASNFLGGGGGALAAAYSLTGHQIAPIAGYMLRRVYNSRIGQRADLLQEAIRQRSPLGQQMLNEPVEQGLLGPRATRAAAPAIGQSVPRLSLQGAAAAEDQQNIPGPVQQHKTGGRVNSQKGLATKHQANYRGGNSRYHCAICTMFVKPSACTVVRGHISPQALCDYFEPQKGHERIVDNKHDVVTGANSSKKPTGPIFIDRHIPEWSPRLRTKAGKRVRLWTYLSAHEDTEQKLMQKGETYDQAHEGATLAEKKKAEADGVDWGAYNKEIDGYLGRVQREKVAHPPDAPLHVKPEAALKGEGHHHSSHKGA